jgi:hypothetical protein
VVGGVLRYSGVKWRDEGCYFSLVLDMERGEKWVGYFVSLVLGYGGVGRVGWDGWVIRLTCFRIFWGELELRRDTMLHLFLDMVKCGIEVV